MDMAKVKKIKLFLVLIAAIAVLLPCTSAFQIIKGCSGTTKDTLVKKCEKFVEPNGPKVDPSPDCCSVVQTADIPCFCKYVTPELEKIISMKKVVYVAAKCGRPFAHKTKCGSYIIQEA